MIKLKDLLIEVRARFKKGDVVKILRRGSNAVRKGFGFRKGDFGKIMKVDGPGKYIVSSDVYDDRRGAEDLFWDDELQKLTVADRKKFDKKMKKQEEEEDD